MIGPQSTNSIASTCKVGGSTITSIYPSSAVCDLGTAAARFKDLNASGSIIGSVKTSAVNDVVTNTGTSTANAVALFNGTTGKVIQVGTAAIGTLGALTLANTTASTTTGTGAFICAGGAGIGGKAFIGSNTVIGPAQTVTLENMLTLRGTVTNVSTGPHVAAYVSTDQFPVFQQLNFAHDNISMKL